MHCQDLIDIYGKVSICSLTRDHIKMHEVVNDWTNYLIVDVEKTESGKVHINRLIANVKVYHSDSLLYDLKTDTLGRFVLKDIKRDTLIFKAKIGQYLKQEYTLFWDNVDKEQRHIFCISDSLHVIKIDSIIYSRIPYNSLKAEQDISRGDIYYLHLFPGDSFLDNGDYEHLEKLFGFKYLYGYLRYPNEYLMKAQVEYNNVVFDYLSKKCKCDFKAEYKNELKKLVINKYKK